MAQKHKQSKKNTQKPEDYTMLAVAMATAIDTELALLHRSRGQRCLHSIHSRFISF